jgi:hypothetical protein
MADLIQFPPTYPQTDEAIIERRRRAFELIDAAAELLGEGEPDFGYTVMLDLTVRRLRAAFGDQAVTRQLHDKLGTMLFGPLPLGRSCDDPRDLK